MSHIVTIATRIRDLAALAAACARLGLPAPEQGSARLYSGQAAGFIVRLPDWKFPVVIDPATGTVAYDNYSGAWGNPTWLDRLLQAYAVEKCRLEARRKGLAVTETALADGSIQLQILESA